MTATQIVPAADPPTGGVKPVMAGRRPPFEAALVYGFTKAMVQLEKLLKDRLDKLQTQPTMAK